MADSFFGFGTEMPALGAGKIDCYDDGLLEPEDDIDMLNDETFGDGALYGEDWEEEHKRMAEEHETGGHLYDSQPEQWMIQAVRDSPSPENELESSLSRLVVEDEETSSKAQRIPGRRAPVDLDNLFGPSSPTGLFGAEDLVSGHQNIWGSPSPKGSHLKQQEDGLKVLLKQMQQGGGGGSGVHTLPGISTSLPHALTLDQIEGDGNHQTASIPRAMTVEELERQMTAGRGGRPSIPLPGRAQGIPMPGHGPREPSPVHQQQMPVGTPPQRALMHVVRPGVPIPNGAMPQTLPRSVGSVPAANANQGFYPGLRKSSMPTPRELLRALSPPTVVSLPLVPTPPPLIPSGPSPPPLFARCPTPPPLIAKTPPPGAVAPQKVAVLPPPDGGHPAPINAPLMEPALALTQTERKIAEVLIQARATSPPPTEPARRSPATVNPTKSTIAMAIINSLIARQGNGDGTPLGSSPSQANRMPHPKTPHQQRIPPHHAHTDPSHHRGQRGAHHPNQHPPQPSHLKQNLFQERGRFDERMQHNGRHEPFINRPEPFGLRPDFRNGPPRPDRGGFVPNGRGYPHPSMERRGFSHHNGDRGGYHPHPRDWEGHYYPDRGRGGGGGGGPHPYDERDYRKRGPGEHFSHKQRHMVGPAGDEADEESETRDVYDGLMTRKEKDWIIKIQLMQLQTDNPYLDDYYYTVWHIKKLAREREEQRKRENKDVKEPALVLPQLAGRVETKAYMPVQFENSLGRLTAASVHNPRKVIDLRREDSLDKEDIKGREIKRFKQLLLDVETAYDVLLVIDDMEKRAHALPEEQRAAVFEDRRKAVHSLYISLHLQHEDSDYFERLVTLRKGIKLVARLLPLLQKEESIHVTQELLRYTHDVMNKKGWTRDVLPQVYNHIAVVAGASKLEHLVMFAKSLQGDRPTNCVSAALQNQFGSSVIWCLLNRGEVIYQTESPLDLDVQDQKEWCGFVETAADCLAVLDATISQNKVGAAHAHAITEHFKRLLDRGSYLSIEDKLLELCVPFARES